MAERSLISIPFMPTYGNWGGEGWSGGEYIAPGQPVNRNVTGIDPLDDVFKAHDIAYEDAQVSSPGPAYRDAIIAADVQLLIDMWAIPRQEILDPDLRDVATIAFLTKLVAESVVDITDEILSAAVGGLHQFFSSMIEGGNQLQGVSIPNNGSINLDFADGSV